MGILNVTPDSFHDGGRHCDAQRALTQGRRMAAEGADWIDVGGESTRPGAQPVDPAQERRRVVPVIRALRRALPAMPISVDSSRASVAQAALQAGATAVNDVSALGDPEMAWLAAESGCDLVLMHMRGSPTDMQREPRYDDVVAEDREFLLARAQRAMEAGVARQRIWIDPGIGFGKTVEHNLALIRGLPVLSDSGFPVLLGASRKSFIGHLLDLPSTEDRLEGSLSVAALAVWLGARMLRVHDVLQTRRAVDVAVAIRRSQP